MKKIKFKRFPGGTIVVPMLIGVVLNSFVPQALQIGGFFTGIVNGTSALVGVFLLFLGATIDVRSTPPAIKIGAVIIGTKVVLAVVLGLGVAFLCNDNFLGLSSLAIISAVSVANNALYSGILLGVVTVFVVGGITVLADKLTGGSGIAGAAISSTAASGVSNPGALAAVDPAYAAIAPIATAQVAASVLITSFLTPLLTSFVAKRKNRKAAAKGKIQTQVQ